MTFDRQKELVAVAEIAAGAHDKTANDIVYEELAADTGHKPDGVEGLLKRPPFPSEGWSTDVASLPRGVSTGVALQHLKSKGKHITTKKPFTRGYYFFFW